MEPNTGAIRSARAQENPDQSRRRRETDNDTTAVRRRIVPAAHSTDPVSAYVNFGNMHVQCKIVVRSDSWLNEMSEAQRPIQSSVTVVEVKSLLYNAYHCFKISRTFSESCLLGPLFTTKSSARILLSITMLPTWLRCAQTG